MTQEDLKKERLLVESEKKHYPHLFERPAMIDDEETLKWIGIHYFEQNRLLGYIKLWPQDFIVEEITIDGSLSTVDIDSVISNLSAEGNTFYADLVKIEISTLEARTQLAELLNIEEKNIGFAGIKDKNALTSQRISLRTFSDLQKLENINADNVFLKNIKRGKGVINNGDLAGNRFIIAVRTQKSLTKKQIKTMEKKIEEMKKQGFWNFFYTQRFGTPRLISHILGLSILKGEYEKTVRTFVTYRAKRELPYFKNIRKEIENLWGNWQAIKEKIKNFPYHFYLEIKLVNYLIQYPQDFVGALKTIPDQIRLWIYAYDGYLFNLKLSELISQGEIPLTLPFSTSFDKEDFKPYQKFLEAHSLKLPSVSYKNFPFIRLESRTCPTLQKIEIHNVKFLDKITVFAFSLPKAPYATTFLTNFFTLTSGLPLISGIPRDKIDAKKLIGEKPLFKTLERFKTVVERKQEDLLKIYNSEQ